MSNHISAEEWILFYSGNMSLSDKLPILSHCATCAKCKALMDAAENLKFSLNKHKEMQYGIDTEEDLAFRAVAGNGGAVHKVDKCGFLSFQMEKTDHGYCFSNEDPVADGWGNRYAMNRSSDGKQFIEDAGAFSASITDSIVFLRLNDPAVKAAAHLILDGEELPPRIFSNELSLILPEDGYCELEIVFMEG